MQRTAASIVLVCLIALLSACGFQLRGDAQIAAQFNPIYLDRGKLEPRQYKQLQQALQRAGAELSVDRETARRLSVSLSSPRAQRIAGSSLSDVELRRLEMHMQFRLSDGKDQTLLQDDIMRMRQIELDTNNVLAHERQLEQAGQELERELIRVMLFRMTHFR